MTTRESHLGEIHAHLWEYLELREAQNRIRWESKVLKSLPDETIDYFHNLITTGSQRARDLAIEQVEAGLSAYSGKVDDESYRLSWDAYTKSRIVSMWHLGNEYPLKPIYADIEDMMGMHSIIHGGSSPLYLSEDHQYWRVLAHCASKGIALLEHELPKVREFVEWCKEQDVDAVTEVVRERNTITPETLAHVLAQHAPLRSGSL